MRGNLNFQQFLSVAVFNPINKDFHTFIAQKLIILINAGESRCCPLKHAYVVKSYNGKINLSLDAKIALFVAYVMYGFSNHALALAESDTEIMSLIENRIGYKKLSSFLRVVYKYDQNVTK